MNLNFRFETYGNDNESIFIDLINSVANLMESPLRCPEMTPCAKQRVYQYARIRFNPDYVSENFDEMLGEDND